MHDLPELMNEEFKFSGRNRLYIGNLTSDVTEEELKEMFKPYGEISEAFINSEKNFAFLKLDFHVNAERAKKELDGTLRKNKPIRIRFAPNATTIRVKNLTSFVSNELLYKAFEVFGQIERAVIVVDDRGKTTGEGIVEFARKSGAMTALKYCQDKCFFLTSSLRPCVVEVFDHIDDDDGFPERSLMKKNNEFYKARQNGPRFAEHGTFEHEFGTKWKQLYDLYKQKHDALKREMQIEEEKLEAQMEYARFEHETESLRDQLRMREQDRDRQKREWENKERQAEEFRLRDEEEMRRTQEGMQLRMQKQDEEMRRRQQENSLFMQAQQLNNMLDQQEISHGSNQGSSGGAAGGGGGRKNFNNDNDNRRNFDMMNQGEDVRCWSRPKILKRLLFHLGNQGGNQFQQHQPGNQVGSLCVQFVFLKRMSIDIRLKSGKSFVMFNGVAVFAIARNYFSNNETSRCLFHHLLLIILVSIHIEWNIKQILFTLGIKSLHKTRRQLSVESRTCCFLEICVCWINSSCVCQNVAILLTLEGIIQITANQQIWLF